uniref:Piwi domain-containing protein n=1 Tax=Romanomermis culicivorax TaxID=13658 RepID=A0A915K8F7_ROMCU
MTNREDGTTMFMGIDVTHPGPTDRHTPSIAAVVSTIDPRPARFGASINVQKFRREALTYVTDAIRDRIYAFYAQCGKAPMRIVVYRDGVSEGQFVGVLKEEVNKIRAACQEMSVGFKPKITFIVVQKRHHTRFFCMDQRDMCGKARNIPPGTVVDSEITNPESYDFFICSHFGIQGTSRPSHYHVLLDENKFTPNDLQQMTYFLCHMYARCTRSVSIPAPVYYAHLACARARNHLFRVMSASCYKIDGDEEIIDKLAEVRTLHLVTVEKEPVQCPMIR